MTLYRHREDLAARNRPRTSGPRALARDGKDFESTLEAGARALLARRRTAPEADATGRARTRRSRPAQQAIALEPKKPEGHFWMAANMGALAESYGLRQGIKYRGQIKESWRRVLRSIRRGSRDRPIARWAGGTSGAGAVRRQRQQSRRTPAQGAHLQPEEHRHACISWPRRCSTTGSKDEARKTLQQVLDAPLDPDWAPEDNELQAEGTEDKRSRHENSNKLEKMRVVS